MYVLVVSWGSTYTKSLKSTENLTSFCSPSEYRKTTCSWDLGFHQMYWKEMKLKWHKRKKVTLLHKCRHSSPNLHDTATPTKTKGQKNISKLYLLFLGSISYLEIILVQPTKSFFLFNTVLLHKWTRLFLKYCHLLFWYLKFY